MDEMLIAGQDETMINKLKKELSKFIDMKDLGPTKQILGMKIVHDIKTKKLWMSQKKYVEQVIKRFNTEHSKPVATLLFNHFKLNNSLCPTTMKKMKEMVAVPYLLAIGNLMYAMVCTMPNIVDNASIVSRFISNLGK